MRKKTLIEKSEPIEEIETFETIETIETLDSKLGIYSSAFAVFKWTTNVDQLM